jgi:GT2 family glycosyltransferase
MLKEAHATCRCTYRTRPMNSGIVTLIIPVRDRAEYLDSCLEALKKQEAVTHNMPILVCDDGSTTDIGSAVERHKEELKCLEVLRQSAKGPAAARNLGISESASEIVILLDSDVIPDRKAMGLLVEALLRNKGWVGAEACIRPTGGHYGPLWDAPTCDAGGRYHTAAIAYRREALIKAGGLDETFTLPACEDVELAVRLLRQGDIGFVPEAVVFHPRRQVSLRTCWLWRRHWRYVMILAKRYGFLAFPGRPAGPFPRLRVARAAVLTLPAGRFLKGLRHITYHPHEGIKACIYALFDVLCGVCALPSILFGRVSTRRNYLRGNEKSTPEADREEEKGGARRVAS